MQLVKALIPYVVCAGLFAAVVLVIKSLIRRYRGVS